MSEKRILRVGLIQQANTADHSDNKRRLKEAIRSAAAQGAELVVLQELHNGLYFCQTEDVNVFDQAEPIPGPSTEEFGALAAELGIVLVLSLFERRAAGCPQYLRGLGARRLHRWEVSQDAHPR